MRKEPLGRVRRTLRHGWDETREDVLFLLTVSPFALVTVIIPIFSLSLFPSVVVVIVDSIVALSGVRYVIHRANDISHHEAARMLRHDMNEFVTEPFTGFQEREER
jgi:hypothetical protein